MQCPVCSVPLQMMERQGVEIDYCPQCRGVWLDRGELDKILERSAAQAGPAPGARLQTPAHPQQPPYPQQPGYPQAQPGYRRDHDDDDWDDHYKKRRRKNWLEELFD